MQQHKQFILFDLDGTLTNPKEGITKSFQYALAQMGITENDLDALEKVIGPPLWDSFQQDYGLSRVEADQAVQHYRKRYRDIGLYENEVIPGIPQLLEALKTEGKSLVVATSKPTVFSITIMEHYGLADYFEAVIGSNLDGTRSHKHEVIGHILSHASYPLDQVVMIGDRKYDIEGASMHGIASIGVLFGFGSRAELEQAGAQYIAETVAELEEILLG